MKQDKKKNRINEIQRQNESLKKQIMNGKYSKDQPSRSYYQP